MFGLLVIAAQFLLLLNACVGSIRGRWAFGAVLAVVRTALIVLGAIVSAQALISPASAQPSFALAVAALVAPAISFLALFLAFRRQGDMPALSDAQATAGRIVTAWIGAATIDAMFLVIAAAAYWISTP